MAKKAERSLHLSMQGQHQADKALLLVGTKADLAAELEMSRTTITNFFAGRPVDRQKFLSICQKLKLKWQNVVELEAPELELPENSQINALVQEVREQIRPLIQESCGTMRVLDMTQPIELEGERGIYTNVNILEKVIGRRRLEIAELLKQCDSEEFDRFGLSQIVEIRIPGLDAVERYSKLMVLGKPGAGKTTFLKYLAMQCIDGRFLADHVPIFVTLKRFAETKGEPDLLDYVCDELLETKLNVLQRLINAGKVFFLLDGLDEVREEDTERVINQIQDISNRFSRNQLVITCRIAAKDYTFQSFIEVEVADFDDEQIQTFSQNWFRAKNDEDRAESFIEKLEENKPIKELATSPLLLTLLCWIFEERGDLPKKRHKLYQEGMDLLLGHWDKSRLIERDRAYKNLSLKQRKNLLSKIALNQFERQGYFFEPETIEEIIADFLYQLDNNDLDLEADSRAILKSIEAHHGLLVERAKGIYSFSHLTFQEYFAAREIVETRDPNRIQKLASYITEKRWCEVFLLTASMMQNADYLFLAMKDEIENIIVGTKKVQIPLKWVYEKFPTAQTLLDSSDFEIDEEADAIHWIPIIRAICLESSIEYIHDIDLTLISVKTENVDVSSALSLHQAYKFHKGYTLAVAMEPDIGNVGMNELDSLFVIPKLQELQKLLRPIKKPEFYQGTSANILKQVMVLSDWWDINGERWNKEFRRFLFENESLIQELKFDKAEIEKLMAYYDANKLLVECLNLPDICVTRNVREKIEETLLLPIEEINRRKTK